MKFLKPVLYSVAEENCKLGLSDVRKRLNGADQRRAKGARRGRERRGKKEEQHREKCIGELLTLRALGCGSGFGWK